MFLALSFCAVTQFLAGDTVANPRKGFESLRIDFLPAIKTHAKCTLVDPLQCPINYTQQRAVTRFLAKVQFSRQRHVCAIAFILPKIVLRSEYFLPGWG